MSKLYIIPTPVGNLEDITLRAIRILKESDLILAEDTRVSAFLMNHLGIKKPMISYHKFNEHKTVDHIVEKLQSGEKISLVSDAGTPGISDPGFLLIRSCVRAGVEVECLPGATAFVPALVCSALPCDRFSFEGFLPQKKGRMTFLAQLAQQERTMILYESPYRLVKTLSQLQDSLGSDRQGAVCREISKLHEEIVRGTLAYLIDFFTKKEPKGEIVLIVEGCCKKKIDTFVAENESD